MAFKLYKLEVITDYSFNLQNYREQEKAQQQLKTIRTAILLQIIPLLLGCVYLFLTLVFWPWGIQQNNKNHQKIYNQANQSYQKIIDNLGQKSQLILKNMTNLGQQHTAITTLRTIAINLPHNSKLQSYSYNKNANNILVTGYINEEKLGELVKKIQANPNIKNTTITKQKYNQNNSMYFEITLDIQPLF